MRHSVNRGSQYSFAVTPQAEIQRSSFNRSHNHKTAFDAGYLIPIFVDEALPGDTFNLRMTSLARMATPIFPIMDNLHLDTFFFAVPYRLLWVNFKKFMGEQQNPGDSISYLIPTSVGPAGGHAVGSLHDYMGIPTAGQITGGNQVTHNNLPMRAYNLIWNTWFRDENMQSSITVDTGDGPDTYTNYVLQKRGKRHDYFTSALPWPQKGNSVNLPLGTSAPVYGNGKSMGLHDGTYFYGLAQDDSSGSLSAFGGAYNVALGGSSANTNVPANSRVVGLAQSGETGVYADLTNATAATINQLRQSFQIQKMLEKDARGGTRYIEIIKSHFGVDSPDARMQRPEYLGGGTSPIVVNAVPQTSVTAATPQGNLAAYAYNFVNGHGFTKSFTEHCVIIGLVCARADLTYQQGLNKMWKRSTRYDFYWPSLAYIGEQSVLQGEIYAQGTSADDTVFGYQERYAEYRYKPSMVTGIMRSTAASTLEAWHLAQKFTAAPTLNTTFISESVPMDRILAVPSQPDFIFDSFFDLRCVRPMPVYSVPGLIDHF